MLRETRFGMRTGRWGGILPHILCGSLRFLFIRPRIGIPFELSTSVVGGTTMGKIHVQLNGEVNLKDTSISSTELWSSQSASMASLVRMFPSSDDGLSARIAA